MAKVITSQALEPVNKALGLAGSGDAQTELTDGIVDQVLDVGPIVRRGRALPGTQGIFRCVLETNHVGSSTVSSAVELYSFAAGLEIPPWPNPVPDTFDIWLLGASLIRLSGSGNVAGALRVTNVQQGWGVDEVGAAIVSTEMPVVSFWNSINSSTNSDFGLDELAQPYQQINMRIPRKGATAAGPFLNFSMFSSAAAVYQCVMMLGLFPIALGQDAAF